MVNKRWKRAGILGSVLVISAGAGTLVYADDTSTEVTNDNSTASVLETADWGNMAAADVKTCANIRVEASEEADKAGVLPKGAAARVLEQGSDWTKIVSGEIEGYVKTELLTFADEAKNLYEETYGNPGVVDATSLRVRKTPSMDGEVIGTKSQGSRVKILGQEGDWYQVEYGNDSQGYMFAEYINIEEVTAITVEEYRKQQAAAASGSSMTADSGELNLLAAIIECEAGGESHTGKVAVGAVIMNRVRSGQFPNSITGVVYQSGQFSPVASGRLAAVLSRGARSDCFQAAQEALNGSNPIGGALYFNSGSGRGQQIGNQHFY